MFEKLIPEKPEKELTPEELAEFEKFATGITTEEFDEEEKDNGLQS